MTLKDILKSVHIYYDGPERRQQQDEDTFPGLERRGFRPTCLTIALATAALTGMVTYILLTHEPHYPNKYKEPTIKNIKPTTNTIPTSYPTNYQSQE
ncbi:MAG: hypothetical protein U9R08_02665 [Nanoarchaeota archaeon]|nr:hypothetical protein [Nanoarchaeota archaeon]